MQNRLAFGSDYRTPDVWQSYGPYSSMRRACDKKDVTRWTRKVLHPENRRGEFVPTFELYVVDDTLSPPET